MAKLHESTDKNSHPSIQNIL